MLPSWSGVWREMSGLWEWTGGEQSLHCPPRPFGCRHAVPSWRHAVSFWLCGAWCPGLWLLVTDPLCPQCLLLLGPQRSGHYPSVIGAWAPADQRYPDDCRALVIFHSLMLANSSQFVWGSRYPSAFPPCEMKFITVRRAQNELLILIRSQVQTLMSPAVMWLGSTSCMDAAPVSWTCCSGLEGAVVSDIICFNCLACSPTTYVTYNTEEFYCAPAAGGGKCLLNLHRHKGITAWDNVCSFQ